MSFPIHRKRRLRVSESMRRLVRETHLEPSNLVLPLFVCPGEGIRKEISSMPGNAQLSIDNLVKECEAVHGLGFGGVILFGIPEHKDELASEAYSDNGIIQRAVREIKRAVPNLLVITDVCNCEYTSHGHCGKSSNGDVITTHARLAGRSRGLARARGSRHRRALRHDGWPRRRHPPFARRLTVLRTRRFFLTRRNTLLYSMDLSGKPPNRRRSSATAALIRWTPPTAAKPCMKWSSTWKKAPTC